MYTLSGNAYGNRQSAARTVLIVSLLALIPAGLFANCVSFSGVRASEAISKGGVGKWYITADVTTSIRLGVTVSNGRVIIASRNLNGASLLGSQSPNQERGRPIDHLTGSRRAVRYNEFDCSLRLVVLACFPYPLWIFLAGPLRRNARLRRSMCAWCAYDVRGQIKGRCPECGAFFETERSVRSGLTLKTRARYLICGGVLGQACAFIVIALEGSLGRSAELPVCAIITLALPLRAVCSSVSVTRLWVWSGVIGAVIWWLVGEVIYLVREDGRARKTVNHLRVA